MKITIDGINAEGTHEEIVQFIKGYSMRTESAPQEKRKPGRPFGSTKKHAKNFECLVCGKGFRSKNKVARVCGNRACLLKRLSVTMKAEWLKRDKKRRQEIVDKMNASRFATLMKKKGNVVHVPVEVQ